MLASKIDLPERYRVTRHVASGGMASVWEAEDLLLDRIVAVKVLGAQYARDPVARARFQREARTAAKVSDQTNVVTIYDIGEHRDDAFIVMEYFAGGTVADRLHANRDSGSLVPRATAMRWLREAAAGLDVAHASGIVHRDVKPANLLLDAQDRLAVADFGIARLADDTHMTLTGQVLGTAAYISPEQALGRPASPASDRYALAVIAYELLTGARPFAGGPATAQALQHVRDEIPRASRVARDLPPAVDAVFGRGLAKDPADRQPTATALIEELARALDAGEPVEPTRPMAALEPTRPIAAVERPIVAREPKRPTTPTPAIEPRREPVAAPQPARAGTPWPVIGAVLLVVAAIAAVIAVTTAGSKSHASAETTSTPRKPAASSPQTTTPAATTPATATPAAPQTQTRPSATDPAALNDRGKALSDRGQYAVAVAPLRAAVAGYRAAGDTRSLPYAFALYNLAVALDGAGSPAAAIPLLQERLTFDNQRAAVRAELARAQAAAADATAGSTGTPAEPTAPAAPGPGARPGKARGPKGGDGEGHGDG